MDPAAPTAKPKLIEKLVSFEDGGHNEGLIIKEEQVIPEWFIDACRAEYDDSGSTLAGDFHRVARIPTGLADKWMREGFDVFNEPVEESVKRLRKEMLDVFITSKKVW